MKANLKYLLLLIYLSLPAPGIAQDHILDKVIRIQVPETSVRSYLQAMEITGGITFSYGKYVPLERIVPAGDRELKVSQHLNLLFPGDSLEWIERGNKILILKKSRVKHNTGQVLRGKVMDLASLSPIAGANLMLFSEGPSKGNSSDDEGRFRFLNVAPGWHEIQCSFVGYRPVSTRILVRAGKESIIEIPMEELAFELDEIEVHSRMKMSAPLNRLAVVSGRSFSAYEVESYPGSISDISRVAISFPGVVSTNDGQNHIVIRGNSPKGLGWRMEGIEIPNLNHFSEIGASGGGVSVLSNNMLDRSDFLTGAFPAEYGNALSGVFDLRLRTGNNERHEKTIQLGLLGLEAMIEGPLNQNSGATYIAQYRYSTLKLIREAGVDLESIPDFQDLSFKFYLPTRKAGTFSLFGIGGLSHEEGARGYDMDSDMFTVGVKHIFTLDDRSLIRTVIAASGRTFGWEDSFYTSGEGTPVLRERLTDILDQTLRASFLINHKLGKRHQIRGGINAEMAWNRSYMGWEEARYTHIYVDDAARASCLDAHLNWSWSLAPGLILNTGGHYTHFYLNGKSSLEPRLAMEWLPAENHRISAAFGIHSQKESMTLYLGQLSLDDGSIIQPNLDLELAKSRHYVLGYGISLSPVLSMRAELYYQQLYDIPAYPFPPYFTSMNFDYGFEGSPLINYGSGYNSGFELNLERQMHRGISFLWNATVYDSKYTDRTGRILNTKYNGSYTSNGIIVKEFKLGSTGLHTLSLSSRYIFAGGLRYLPIDEEASAEAGQTIRIWDDGFTGKWDDYFRIDLMLKYRRNRERITSEWSLDFQNILNRQNALSHYWDQVKQEIHYTYQNQLLVFISYRIQF